MNYSTADELLDLEVPKEVRSVLYPMFLRGTKAFEELINEEAFMFNSTFLNNCKGQLRTFLIFRQFDADLLSSNFPFSVVPKEVNHCRYTTLNLQRGNVLINVAKEAKQTRLPSRSKFRLDACKTNNFRQNTLFFDENGQVQEEPYYLLLTYGYRYGSLNFVDLVVPDVNMRDVLAVRSLKSEYVMQPKSLEEKELEEELLVKLKYDAIEQLKVKAIANG